MSLKNVYIRALVQLVFITELVFTPPWRTPTLQQQTLKTLKTYFVTWQGFEYCSTRLYLTQKNLRWVVSRLSSLSFFHKSN